MTNPAMLLPEALPAIQALIKSTHRAGVPASTMELVHLRASQINGCSACVHGGSVSAKKGGETDERLFAVVAWREAPWFTDAERAALALAESITRLADRSGEAVPEELWADYAPQLSSMLNTIPFEQMDHGEIVVTPDQFREWYARAELTGGVQCTVMTREPDGVISGITDTMWAPYHRTIVYQQFTGVRPDARGRGLGKWIKAAMLRHLRELYPDLEWMATDNAGSNAPMLKINRAMGFRPYRQGSYYQMTRDELEKRLPTR